jgi:F420-dependent oxidoreductase-like protein
MSTQRPLRFGIKTSPQYSTYEDILRVWREADEVPIFEDAWLFDHFMALGRDPGAPVLEAWTLLAALAAQTTRIRVGVLVTGNTYRHPAVLAKTGATVDVISHGRLIFGIGAGWNEPEHAALGIPLPAPGERIRRLGEACEIIRRLWTEPPVSFEGRYYQLRDALAEPRPVQKPHPPFMIGGSGEQLTLRVVAHYADIWNDNSGDVEQFRHKNAVLDQHCAEIGRDPTAIERSIQEFVNLEDLGATRDSLRAYIAAGATHLILNLRPPYPDGVARRLVGEVAEPLCEEHDRSA